MGNFLDKAKDEKDSHELVTTEGIKAGCSGMQGWRLEMEVCAGVRCLLVNA